MLAGKGKTMKRIFISYRSSDGRKDANRLAEDLSMVFGDEQVFYDKRDLQAGSTWRQVIASALDARPIVLLVLSPDFFGGRHADGRLRFDDADDPVRQELGFALQHAATVVPLRGEGVDMPLAESLPPDLRAVTERHAPRLRTEDWRQDFQRLVEDLVRQGLEPARDDWRSLFGGAPEPVEARPWLLLAVLALVVFAVLEASARQEIASDTWYGAGALALLPLALLWLAGRRLKQTGAAARWGGIVLLVAAALWTLSFFVRGASLPPKVAEIPPTLSASSPAREPAPPASMPALAPAADPVPSATAVVTRPNSASAASRPASAGRPAVVAAPKPASAMAEVTSPTVPASAVDRTPTEACRNASKLDLTCIWRQCNRRPEFAQAPECIKLREEHERKTNLSN
jgi:hypothetical protein